MSLLHFWLVRRHVKEVEEAALRNATADLLRDRARLEAEFALKVARDQEVAKQRAAAGANARVLQYKVPYKEGEGFWV